ncbi:hypothetical protein MY5147_000305 [Beauveria neobassiana]|uniref:Uncharacterized protein n=1 Tax=Beauveria bassiana TaxID=176275 RepID=A0A2S7XYZ1_BEABA|nr:hypothetical protein BB8028_0001g09240 [Beauveria bassiana]
MTTISLAPVPHSGPSLSSPTTVGSSLPVPVRPKFNSHITSDRLREGAGLRLPPFAVRVSNIQKDRRSVFRELGLEGDVAFGDDTYLVVREDALQKPASGNDDDGDDATSTTTGGRNIQQQTSRSWYAKLAARPALTKRRSSKGRAVIPSVNVISPDSQ